jgi:hypothetical protein
MCMHKYRNLSQSPRYNYVGAATDDETKLSLYHAAEQVNYILLLSLYHAAEQVNYMYFHHPPQQLFRGFAFCPLKALGAEQLTS